MAKYKFRWTFQPNLSKYSTKKTRSNSKQTGKFYDRCLNWKENNEKWKEEELNKKIKKQEEEIQKNSVEKVKHSQKHLRSKSRNLLDNKTCLTFHGVSEYLERQFNAQKEKHIVQSILETGRHRNVKKRKQKSRVTIPKKKSRFN